MPLAIFATIISFSAFYAGLELVNRKTRVSSQITRKIAHIFSAVLVLLFFAHLSRLEFIAATSFFSIIFMVSYLKKFLKSIHLEGQKTIGEIMYPVSLVILGLFFYENSFVFTSSVAIMGFSDGISGLYNLKHKKNTPQGSVLFWLITVLVMLTCHVLFFAEISALLLLIALPTSLIITFVERFSRYGTDNLTVPLSSALLLSLFF